MAVRALWLADAARTTGYPVIEVAGWIERGHGSFRQIECVVGHHTATPAHLAGDFPSLGVVRDGRVGLAGPLCNLGLGRSGTIYVVAAGVAWHAGASEHAGFIDLNDVALGIEAENDGSGNWEPEQLDCYPKLVAALLRYMNRGVDRYVSHRECALPPGRKIDPAKISDQWMRDRALVHLVVPAPLPPPTPFDPEPEPPVRDLRRGMRGDDVRELQRVLAAWYGGIDINGIFGPVTERLVIRAQVNVPPQPRLIGDGIVGRLTRRKLGL